MGLGAGKSRQEILAEIGQEVEGINTVRELHSLSLEKNIEMPITNQVYQIVHQGKAPSTAVQELLDRASSAESG